MSNDPVSSDQFENERELSYLHDAKVDEAAAAPQDRTVVALVRMTAHEATEDEARAEASDWLTSYYDIDDYEILYIEPVDGNANLVQDRRKWENGRYPR